MPILLILGIIVIGALFGAVNRGAADCGAVNRAWMRKRYDNRIRRHAPWTYKRDR